MEALKDKFNPRLQMRKLIGGLFLVLVILCVLVGVTGLVSLLARVLVEGLPSLDWHFLTTRSTSRHVEESGILSAMVGTAWIMFLTALFTVPIGVGAAVYLEEYAPKNKLTNFIEINISNLAGVPSIVYGLLGLAVFVNYLALGRVILAAGLTLSLLVLPIVILASREAIRAVPSSHREGGVRPRRDAVGGHSQRRAALGGAGHRDGHHPRALTRHRRGGAHHSHRGGGVHHLRSSDAL